MAELPAYHGRTHAPGGTDPIQLPTIKTATMSAGLRSMTASAGTFQPITFSELYSNDPSFGYLGVVGSAPNKRAKYIEITEEGLYFVQGNVFWDTDFSGSQNPYIELTVYFPTSATQDLLINSVTGEAWTDGNSPIYGEQLTADEYAHEQMVQTVWFNFSTADFGESTIGIGVGIGIGSTGGGFTKGVGGAVVVSRMGDLLTETVVA